MQLSLHPSKEMYLSDMLHLWICKAPFLTNTMRTILIGFIEVLLNIYHAFFVKRLSAKKQIDKWINDLDGSKKDKVAIITGGTSGIGKEIAYSLAKAQYKVIIAARNEELARNVVQDMKIVTKNQNVSFIKVDFSSLESVKKFTTEFVAMKVPLDLLISNILY